ncbi:rod shape-determining protein MreD [Acetobacter musti]|uniref:Rod shape-determining protein MreD n=1 Tax=Acetobacter musti TaxID=864732 RepID=A0ABX0JPM3_9PROT|nr:rod shape-determining protein MreD [Acetobacter musti]NHN85217.1 rod shape-determining protein MreD [Acetobacter musti]
MSVDPYSHWHPDQSSGPALAQRLDRLARRLLPGGVTALMIVILAAPSGIPGATALLPGLVMSSVFFWSVWRPASMSAPVVFLIGLLMDLIGFAPLGVDAFVLLLLHGIAVHTRFGLMGLSFLAIWVVFSVLAAAACWLLWLLISVLSLNAMPTAPAVFETLLAVGIYPPMAAAGSWLHRRVWNPEPQA